MRPRNYVALTVQLQGSSSLGAAEPYRNPTSRARSDPIIVGLTNGFEDSRVTVTPRAR